MWEAQLNNWKLIPVEGLKICFDQAGKRLDSLCKESERITSLSYTLLGIYLSIISASLFLFSGKEIMIAEKLGIVVFILLILVSVCYLYKNIKPRLDYKIGTEPKSVLNSEFLENNPYPEKAIYISETEHMQYKIDALKSSNLKRINNYHNSIKIAVWSTIIMVIFIMICELTSFFPG